MQLLNESESWNLLRQEVFGYEEDCPDELQGIGEKISRDCGGLPLAINVMGGLLSKVERSIGVWENIAKNIASAITEADEQFSNNILTLSYSHLPNHLKPCFLHMGAFPEDHEIKGSKLVFKWMAEGFVKSNGNKSLEEEAEGCLKALVERNLIFVSRYSYGNPIYYGMHDLLRDLCIRKSNEDKFLYVGIDRVSIRRCRNGRVRRRRNPLGRVSLDRVSNPRRVCVAKSSPLEERCIPLVRSFIVFGRRDIEFEAIRLVRVLALMDYELFEFPTEIFRLVNLRFLAVRIYQGGIPSGISRLKNLQTLISEVGCYPVTSEIFAMSELRHIQIDDLSISIDEKDMKTIAPNKLQTVSLISTRWSLIKIGFFESIPDIKHLGLCQVNILDLSHLHKLETLISYGGDLSRSKYPSGLRELVLRNFSFYPSVSVTKTLCAQPNLEVLIMFGCKYVGKKGDLEWEVAEGDEFPSLKVLDIKSYKLVHWIADETNFPTLRRLRLSCKYLEEIPSGIGEIPPLELIELKHCRDSLVASARQIVEEQHSDYDNYTLQLRIK